MRKQTTKRKNGLLKGIFNWDRLALCGVILLLCLMMLVAALFYPVQLLSDWHRARRKRSAVTKVSCGVCDNILGLEALENGEGRWREVQAEHKKLHPNRYIRRTFDAVCVFCDLRYVFESKENTFAVAAIQS